MADALADSEHGYELIDVIDRPGEDLGARLDDDGIECLFLDPTDLGPEEVGRVSRLARSRGVDVTVCAYLEGTMHTRLGIRSVGDMLALSTPRTSLSGLQRLVKRGFDLTGAAILLVVTAPVWAVAAAAIRATSPGPVLFRQTRVGRDGRPFRILKFRTMVDGADGRLAELRDRNEFAGGVLFKIRNDPRVTRVGRVLRRFSLDELPQLVNVLRGDMSMVGPRPALPAEVAVYEDWHRERLVVRPGLTGLWQVSGRSESCFDEYVRLDLLYVENWSLTLDLYVMAKTIPALLRARGAY
jgi:exopolysaccharide biosynthesis polyprenyl glycosylphosphotransferase